MEKNAFLKELTVNGYNIGFGAKKNFATYDIVQNVPPFISLIGLLIGVGQLAYPHYNFSTGVPTILIMASIIALTMSSYNSEKEKYNKTAIRMTELYNRLREMYYDVKSSSETEFINEEKELKEIKNEFYSIAISKQVFGADWVAHYYFFRQMQIDWIEEERNFKLLKDKLPLSLIFCIFLSIVICYVWYFVFVK